jgi:hypothetical protein
MKYLLTFVSLALLASATYGAAQLAAQPDKAVCIPPAVAEIILL